MTQVLALIALAIVLPKNITGQLHTTNVVTDTQFKERLNGSDRSQVAARTHQVSVRYPSGKAAEASVIVLYDSPSELYLSVLFNSSDGIFGQPLLNRLQKGSAVGVSKDRMVWLFVAGPILNILESSNKARSLDEASEQSLRSIESRLLLLEKGEGRQYRHIPIGTQLGAMAAKSKSNFFSPWFSSKAVLPIKASMLYRDPNWEVTIAANLIAKVILDSNYNLLSVDQILGKGPAAAYGHDTVLKPNNTRIQ